MGDVGGTLLDGEQEATQGRTERCSHPGGGATGYEITFLFVSSVGFVVLGRDRQGGGLALGETGRDDRARVNHGALLAHGEAAGHGADDAKHLADEGAEAHQLGDVDAVEVALDLGDPGAHGLGGHDAAEGGQEAGESINPARHQV